MNIRIRTLGTASAIAVAASMMLAGGAMAQTSTATVRGSVADAADGTAEAGATVVATEINTGFVSRATVGADGNYALTNLRPGSYRFVVTSTDGQTATQDLTLQVGQQASLAFDVGALGETDAGATQLDDIVVTGIRSAVEVKTSEIATNVTTRQIESLPQNNRNFLNFAALAPGIRLNQDEFRRDFAAGGNVGSDLGSNQVNVFIDGVSLKSNVNQGGLVGQDSSRGNPFSQLAIGEFRVATSNFKAEYEQAGTALITAITKSGTNEFHGEVFGFYQNEDFTKRNFFQRRNGQESPALSRKQYGFALGGPIIEDRLQFFVSYEVNDQVRNSDVLAGGSAATRATLPSRVNLADFEGSFPSPFKEELYFGKLTWRPTDNQTVELSVNYNTEDDVRGFGGQTSLQRAEKVINELTSVKLQYDFQGSGFFNEASIDYRDSLFQPTVLNPDIVGQNFNGIIQIGGGSTSQEVSEENLTFRDNITFSPVELYGSHLFKIGGKVSYQKYSVFAGFNTNPTFFFDLDPAQRLDYSFPSSAVFGVGQPTVTAENTQVGLFVQDDWEITNRLTVNLGLRWDYETNANNNEFVTPANAVAALRALETTLSTQPGNFFRAEDYISTGDNRDAFTGGFGPRFGFSYDVFDDQRTVIFGGAGRFYDRTLFRNAAEESLFRQFANRTFRFSRDGQPRNGEPTIVFQESFLSREGLNALIASGVAPNGELRVVRNDQEPPYTDQFSIGLRQKLGDWQTSFSIVRQIGKNEVAYFPANRSVARNASGFFNFIPVPGFGQIVADSGARETRYTGVYITADKPYTRDSGWGATFAYTGSDSEQKGYSFNFDFPNVANQPFFPNAGDVEHQIVATGLVDLPFDFQLSTFITLSTGTPFFVVDASQGFGQNLLLGNFGQPGGEDGPIGDIFPFRQVDLRLTKTFRMFDGHEFQLIGEVFNVFDSVNFGGYDGFIPPTPETNANFGRPGGVSGPPRTFQIGARYKF